MPFVKGQSGNPGGKPKPARQELDGLLTRGWPIKRRMAAIERLDKMVDSEDDTTALDAIKLLLAYAYGRPTERKEISGPDSGPIPFNYVDTIADLAGGSDGDP